MNLDEPARFGEVDSADALGDLEGLAEQWAAAAELEVPNVRPSDAVVVTGMGGSGIAGDVAAALAAPALPVPVLVHKGYGLPAFAGPNTLVVAVSHSGNTAETLDAARTGLERGCRLVAITGGGTVAELAGEGGAVVVVPQRTPPRHALPSLVLPLLRLLGVDDDLADAVAAVKEVVGASGRAVATERNPAKQLGLRFAETGTGTALGAGALAAVAAYRCSCQLAENAKVALAHGQLPEAAHNLAATWTGAVAAGGLVVLRDPAGESPALARQVDAAVSMAADSHPWTTTLNAVGATPLGRLASLMALVDLVSVYAALALDRDPTPIEAIDALKEAGAR